MPASVRTAPPAAPRRARQVATWSAVLGLALVTGCSGAPATPPPGEALTASTSPGPAAEETASPDAVAPADPTLGRAPVEVPVAELTERRRPDVLVTAPQPFAPEAVKALGEAAPPGGTIAFRTGVVKVGGQDVRAVGVDPGAFRAFAAEGTAEATAVWQAVARGEAVVSHEAAKALGLQLGGDLTATGSAPGATPQPLRLGALATTGIPAADLVVADRVADALGLPPLSGVLLSGGKDVDPQRLADKVRGVVGEGADVDLLAPPAADPVAFLTGSKAAKAFGGFSYRYFPDGTIQPDASWVKANIQTATLPIMGRVTCHRLMIPQLRGALQEVQDAGLGGLLKTYDGCYVPRFIERNPENSISLHTWGIAIDMDAATNYRGIRGTMDLRIVEIFKRWGFRWGGDWQYTDPMHFELGALLTPTKKK